MAALFSPCVVSIVGVTYSRKQLTPFKQTIRHVPKVPRCRSPAGAGRAAESALPPAPEPANEAVHTPKLSGEFPLAVARVVFVNKMFCSKERSTIRRPPIWRRAAAPWSSASPSPSTRRWGRCLRNRLRGRPTAEDKCRAPKRKYTYQISWYYCCMLLEISVSTDTAPARKRRSWRTKSCPRRSEIWCPKARPTWTCWRSNASWTPPSWGNVWTSRKPWSARWNRSGSWGSSFRILFIRRRRLARMAQKALGKKGNIT